MILPLWQRGVGGVGWLWLWLIPGILGVGGAGLWLYRRGFRNRHLGWSLMGWQAAGP